MPLRPACSLALAVVILCGWWAAAADQPQWGQLHTRNMVSDERGLPERFDPQTGDGVKWSVPLGTGCYSTPIVAGGRVLIGATNEEPRDPRRTGDLGVLLCLGEADGKLQWQLAVPRIGGDIFLDWPNIGICSPPTVEGDRVYLVTNRAEVVCLDLDGLADGNDGPFTDEGRHATPADQATIEPGPLDADIVWLFDMRTGAGVHPHDSAHSSLLVDGDYLYLNTGNGLNNQHSGVPKPDAPSLIVVHKKTGRLVARDREGIGPRIFHSTWSSPALGEIAGRRVVFFCGGDGVAYGFEPLAPGLADDTVATLRRVWRYDCDPAGPKENVHQYIRNRKESPSNIKSMPVFHDGRLYITGGGDIWWGKREAFLQSIDATGEVDVTASARRWSYPLVDHCCSTPALIDGLVFVADCGRTIHCVDAETGQPHWTHECKGDIWASTLVADGKLYIGTRRGEFLIFAADRTKKLLAQLDLGASIASTATAANGTLYIATLERLYAIGGP